MRRAKLLGALALLFTAGCGDPRRSSDSTPNAEVDVRQPRFVLLYMPCTVNRNSLSPYDESAVYTPHLSRFAAESMVFERHATEEGQSGLAYASIFTGTQADRHGVFMHPPPVLPDDMHLLGEIFRDGGYSVTYFNGHPMASAKYGFAQGISESEVHVGGPVAGPPFEAILERLRVDPEYKACVVVNFTVTHAPYSIDRLADFFGRFPDAADGFSEAEIRELHAVYLQSRSALEWEMPAERGRLEARGVDFERLRRGIDVIYKSNAAYLDSLFGEMVDQVSRHGLSGESLIVFTADHGETLSRDNAVFHWTHGLQLSPEDIVVPWIIKAPGVPSGRYAQVTRSIDVLPTVATLAGIELPESARAQFEGQDLSTAIREPALRPPLTAFFHSTCNPWDEKTRSRRRFADRLFPSDDIEHVWTGLREGDMLVRHRKFEDGSWAYEVFDLAADPGLARNLYASGDLRHAGWVEALTRYRARLNATFARRSLGEDDLEALRSLGYVD